MGKRAKKKVQGGSAVRAGSNPTSSISSSGPPSTTSSPPESGRLVEYGGAAVDNSTRCSHGANVDKLRNQLAKSPVIHCQDCAKLRSAVAAGKDQRKGKGGRKVARKKLPSASLGLDEKKGNYKRWVCLFCGQVGCGEWNSNSLTPNGGGEVSKVEAKQGVVGKGHAWQHWLQLKHPMVMLVGDEFTCWCFVCEAAHEVGLYHGLSTESAESANPSSMETEEEPSLPPSRDMLLQQAAQLVREKLAEPVADIKEEPQEDCNGSEEVEKPSSPGRLENGVQDKSEAPSNTRVMKGLTNLGNTCFFNSVMQNLLSVELLRSHFGPESSLPEGALTFSLRKFFLEASFHSPFEDKGLLEAGMKKGAKARGGWSAIDGTYNPKGLFGAICSKAPRFKGFQQQDSHELLRCLLDGLHTEEEKALKPSSTLKGGGDDALRALSEMDALENECNTQVDDAEDSSSARQKTENPTETDGGEQKKLETFVERVFGGQLSSTVSCCECGHCSVVYEPFLDLSLPIPSMKQPLKKASAVANGSSATQSKSQRVQALKNSKSRTKTDPDFDAFRSVPAGLGTPLLLLTAPPPKDNNCDSVTTGYVASESDNGWIAFVEPGARASEADWLDFLDDDDDVGTGAVAGCAPNPESQAVPDISSMLESEIVSSCAPNPGSMKQSEETPLGTEGNGILGSPADVVSQSSMEVEQGDDGGVTDAFSALDGNVNNHSLDTSFCEKLSVREAATKLISEPKNPSLGCGAGLMGMRGQEMDIPVQMRGGSETYASDATEEVELNSYPISEQLIDTNVSAKQFGDSYDDTGPQSDIVRGPNGTGTVMLLGPPVDNWSGDCKYETSPQSDIISGPNGGTVILLGPPVDNGFADSYSNVPLEGEYDGLGSLFEEEDSNEERVYGPLPLNQNGVGHQESTFDEIAFDDVLDLSKISSDARGDWLVSNEEGQCDEIAETSMSLEGCLQIFTRSELLSGENAWACENCTKKYHEQLAIEERSGMVAENSAKIVPLSTSPEKLLVKSSGINGGSEYHGNGSGKHSSTGDSCDGNEDAEIYSNGGLSGQDPTIVKSKETSSSGNVEAVEMLPSVSCEIDFHVDGGKDDVPQNGNLLEDCQEGPRDNAERVDSRSSSEAVDLYGAVIRSEPDCEGKPSDKVRVLLGTRVEKSNGAVGGDEVGNDKPEVETNTSEPANKVSVGKALNSGKTAKLKKSKSKKVPPEQKKVIKQDATKRFLISRAPPVLTIQLKRFAQDMRGRLSKLSGHVAFSEWLDLHPFLDRRYVNHDCKYRLIGTVEHSGTLKSGHYVAFVRGPPAQSPTGLKNDSGTTDSEASSWYYVSDSHVHQTNLDAVLQSEAYLVFYERVETSGVSP